MPYVLSTVWVEPGETERVRAWGAELQQRDSEVIESLRAEGVYREAGFLLNTEHGDLYCVFIDVDDHDEAWAVYETSPRSIDHKHREEMAKIQGGRERVLAELLYAIEVPAGTPDR